MSYFICRKCGYREAAMLEPRQVDCRHDWGEMMVESIYGVPVSVGKPMTEELVRAIYSLVQERDQARGDLAAMLSTKPGETKP